MRGQKRPAAHWPMAKKLSTVSALAAVALIFAQDPALSQEGDPVAGRALATHICSECHLVAGPDNKSSQRGPAFSELAKTNNESVWRLKAFLRNPHGEMPEIPLRSDEIDDLISYILAIDE